MWDRGASAPHSFVLTGCLLQWSSLQFGIKGADSLYCGREGMSVLRILALPKTYRLPRNSYLPQNSYFKVAISRKIAGLLAFKLPKRNRLPVVVHVTGMTVTRRWLEKARRVFTLHTVTKSPLAGCYTGSICHKHTNGQTAGHQFSAEIGSTKKCLGADSSFWKNM